MPSVTAYHMQEEAITLFFYLVFFDHMTEVQQRTTQSIVGAIDSFPFHKKYNEYEPTYTYDQEIERMEKNLD